MWAADTLRTVLQALLVNAFTSCRAQPYLQIRGVAVGANFASYVAIFALAYDEFRWQLALYDCVFQPATASLRATLTSCSPSWICSGTPISTDHLFGGGNPFLPHLLMQSQS